MIVGILSVILVLVSLFMILLVLMQRGSASGGLGAAMGGGMAESAFGADTTNVLSKLTRNVAIVFFVLTLTLYLLALSGKEDTDGGKTIDLTDDAQEAPAEGEAEAAAALSSLNSILEQGEAEANAAAEEAGEAANEVVEGAENAVENATNNN